MKRFILIIALLTLLPISSAAHAQDAITLERMVIEVWPEFDQPEALIIYSGQVTEATPTPVTLRITLPSTAELNAVAYQAPEGLLQAEYTQEDDTIVMTSETGLFHIEYYDPAFTYAEQERSYTLVYAADYPTNELVWSIQQPPQAANVSVDPEPAINATNNAGLTVLEGSTQSLQPGDPFSLSLGYTRPTDELVVEAFAAQQPAQPAGQNPVEAPTEPTNEGLSTAAVIAIAVGAGLLVGAGIYTVYMGGPQAALESLGRGSSRGRSYGGRTRKTAPKSSEKTAYCGQCGQPINRGDKFCRHCGATI